MVQVPSNLIPTRVSQLQVDPAPSTSGWMMYIRDGVSYKVQLSSLVLPGTVTQVDTGTGLTGGPITSSGTISLASTGVSAASYGTASSVPTLAVNAQGQITSASNTAIAIGASQITSGILPITYGGTGAAATPVAGAVAYGSGTVYAFTAAGNSGQVLTSTGAGTPTWTTPTTGTVTSVTGTSPVVSSGGATPAISMPAATTSVNGYLTSTDWATFNNKVTSVSGTAGQVTSTGGATPVIDLASGVATPGTTGSASLIPVVTIDTYGRVTSITTAANPQGTVTAVSVASANGLAGTSSGGATPALTLSTSITGVLKGNGTAISAATSGTDYAPATSGSSILYGNAAGGFSNVTIGTGVAFAGGTLSATGSGGTVTSVTGTAPVVSSGGATPAISMAAATTSVNGYLTSTDWTTFNSKQAALVSGTNIKTVNGTTLLGSGDLGTITYAYGGTGLTSYTAGDIIYASGANTVAKLAIGTTGQRLVVAAGLPSWATDTTVGTVTSVGFTGGIITVANPTTTPALTVAGTSGGIPYFSSTSTWATSTLLVANALMVGGGAGLAPSTVTTGTGVVTALGVNTGSAGAFVVNGGALGTPSSGTVTNLTGTASININGTVGATSTNTGYFTTLTASADSSFTSTGAVLMSKGTTAQQPTPATGMLRYNTTTNQFEGYSGASPAWNPVGGASVSNDTATATSVYPLFASATSGTATTLYTSNANYLYKPSTGELAAKVINASNGLVVNSQTVGTSYTMASGDSAMSSGPITLSGGVVVTIPSGGRWVII